MSAEEDSMHGDAALPERGPLDTAREDGKSTGLHTKGAAALYNAVEEYLRQLLGSAEEIGRELECCMSSTYQSNRSLAIGYCRALQWQLRPVVRIGQIDLDVLAGYGVAPASLLSMLSRGILGEDFPRATRWLWSLLDDLPEGIWAGKERPTESLLGGWQKATELLRGCLESNLPRSRQQCGIELPKPELSAETAARPAVADPPGPRPEHVAERGRPMAQATSSGDENQAGGPPKQATDRTRSPKRKWTQKGVDEAIREYKAAGGRPARYAELREAVKKGNKGAKKEARKIFGRNAIAKHLRCSTVLVSRSEVWVGIAKEMGIPLNRERPKGTRRTSRPGPVGHDMAVEELSADASKVVSPSAELEKEEEEETLRRIRLLAESGRKKDAEALLGEYKQGNMTDEQVRQAVQVLLGKAE